MSLRSLLAATDFSEHAQLAALRAALLARELGARRCVLLHVALERALRPADRARVTRRLRRELAQQARALQAQTGAAVVPRLACGPVVETLARAARHFDLVVVGAQGAHPLRDFAIGTSAERLLRRIHRPVLVVKRRPAGAYRRVVVPVDFSGASKASLALAHAVAPGAELSVLHAFEVPYEGKLRVAGVAEDDVLRYRRLARERARADMDTLLGGAGSGVVRLIAHGYPPKLIARTQAEIGADLVAIGKHGRSALEDLLIGSVTLHTLSAVDCDVLVTPRSPRR
ncbi:MAG: universal stress protein [Burkholderiales bacterium]